MDEQEALAALQAKRREIEADRSSLSKPQADAGSISFGKRVGDGTAIAVERMSAVTVHGMLGATLEQIDRALEKIAEGTRQTCDVCGGPIGAERLEARPWATRCVRDS